jgi:hypothetical protein
MIWYDMIWYDKTLFDCAGPFNRSFFPSGAVKNIILQIYKARLHDSHFGRLFGFLVGPLRLHDEIFVLNILDSAHLN